MELGEYGDMEKQLINNYKPNPLPESVIITYLMQLLLGLHTLHSNGIIHRDIKTENIVLANDDRFPNGRAVIVDFGIATECDYSTTMVGTPFYLSPQICMNDNYSTKADIYSLGVVLYKLMTYKFPFIAKS